MANSEAIESTRILLKTTLEKSRGLASEINKISPKLEGINRRLPSLEADIRSIAQKCSLFDVRGHIDRVLGPAASVLKVFEAVCGLEALLLAEPSSDLTRYISLIKQFEDSLKLLTSNCELVIEWLQDLLLMLEENTVDGDVWYLFDLRRSMRILRQLQAEEARSHSNGGTLFAALQKLEGEFRHLLTDNSFPISFPSTGSLVQGNNLGKPVFPAPVFQKLQAIIQRMNCNGQIQRCVSIFVEVRSSNARTTLQALDLDYLDTSLSEFESVQTIEQYIDQWGTHLEFAIKNLYEQEYRLCNEVFKKQESDIWMSCFSKIAISSGIHSFLKFGNTVTKGKKDAVKLLKLLDVFSALDKLRLNFNRLFGGKACGEVQSQTRDLIKKVVNGACEIFWELSNQVKLHRHSSPPVDGSVPRLLSFVTDYLNHLLDENYLTILLQVLEIHQIWKQQEFDKEAVVEREICKIMNEVEMNLQSWSRSYDDNTLSYIFLMNCHWYLSKNLKGTKLGELMGGSWALGHEQIVEYYAETYARESWGRLVPLLSEEGIVLYSGGRTIARDLVKKRLRAFGEAFDEMYKKQSSWVVIDKGLRLKTLEMVVRRIVPGFRKYLENYWDLVEEQGTSPTKYVKYSAEAVENMVSSLFQPKLGKYGSPKCTHLIGKIKNVVINHISSTPAAA